MMKLKSALPMVCTYICNRLIDSVANSSEQALVSEIRFIAWPEFATLSMIRRTHLATNHR